MIQKPVPRPRVESVLLGSVLVIAIVTMTVHVFGALSYKSSLWGAHHYGFFDPILLVIATALAAVGCVAIVWKRPGVGEFVDRRVAESSWARSPWLPVAAALVGAALFWLARTSHTYLGDGNVLISNVPDGQTFHPREPLTMMIQQSVYRIFGPLFGPLDDVERVAWDTMALGSVVAGALFILVTWVLARELVGLKRDSDGRHSAVTLVVLAWLTLLTQGYIQLFFGYVENYSFYTLGIAVFLWLSLRFVRASVPLVMPAAMLLLGMALHIGFVILLPSFGVLCVWALASPEKRRSALRDLLIVSAAFVVLNVALSRMQSDYGFLHSLLHTAGGAVTRSGEAVPLFSMAHVRDFLNEQFLIGPLGIFLFIAAAGTVIRLRHTFPLSNIFLLVAGLSYLGAGWLAGDSNLGYARDWDVWAAGGLVLTATGLGLFLSLQDTDGETDRTADPPVVHKTAGARGTWNAALLCALIISLYHTMPWIAVNASRDRSFERLKTLPLGLGRTEVLVSQWYRREGKEAEQLRWLLEAIVANPNNNNAYHLLGIYHFERGNMDAATEAFRRAVELRPDKLLFRHLLIDALMATGRARQAIPHFEFLLEREPDNAQRWLMYGQALSQAGNEQDAFDAFEKALTMFKEVLDGSPRDYQANLACGWLLFNMGDFDEALRYSEAAHQVKPESASPLCLIGYALRSLGRGEEAVAYFNRCFEIDPLRQDRPAIEAWIRDVSP